MTAADRDDTGTERAGSRRWYQRRWLVALAGLFLLLVVLASSAHVRAGLTSAGFLLEIFPDLPAYPSRWFSSEPERTLVFFPHEDGVEGAYLYSPGETGCHAGLVMYIGLGPEHQDSHLDRVSRAFARNGIAVLIPISDEMIAYRVDAEEHLRAASAFRYMQAHPEIDAERVGMFGISVGGSIVVNAAQEPSINEDVAMVHSLGGYYDATRLLSQMAVGAFEVDGEWHAWEPSSTTFRATRNSIVRLMPSDDRLILWEMFGNDTQEVSDELSSEGRALAELLVNRDPERIDELESNLPDELVQYLDLISPSSGRDRLVSETLLLHDKHDHVLPYSESVRFYREAHDVTPIHLTLIEQFHHVRPDEEGDRLGLIGDGARLLRHVYRMNRSLDDRGWFASPLDLIPGLGDTSDCT